MKFIVGILSLLFLTSGCYQASLAPMIGPAATASQGNLAYSAASTGLSYGIKNTTGKYPIEYIFQREKQKIANTQHWTKETNLKCLRNMTKRKISKHTKHNKYTYFKEEY